MNRGRRSFWDVLGKEVRLRSGILGGRSPWDGEGPVFPCPLNWELM